MTALTLGLIAAFAWGFHDICVRYLSQTVPLMAALLTVLLSGLLFHIGLMTYDANPVSLPPRALGYSVLSGVLFLGASLGLYGAFQRGPVRLVAPIIASFPILSVGWAAASGVEVGIREYVAVLAVITGVSVVAALSDDGDEEIPPKGLTVLLAGIASVCFAGTFAVSQIAAEMSDHLPVTLVTRVTAVVLLIGLMGIRRQSFRPGFAALPLLCLMGIADGVALNSVISAGGLPNAQLAAVAASIFGMLTIVMAWAFLHERMTLWQWAGCLVAFAGIGYLAS